jgi:hypothetical protein
VGSSLSRSSESKGDREPRAPGTAPPSAPHGTVSASSWPRCRPGKILARGLLLPPGGGSCSCQAPRRLWVPAWVTAAISQKRERTQWPGADAVSAAHIRAQYRRLSQLQPPGSRARANSMAKCTTSAIFLLARCLLVTHVSLIDEAAQCSRKVQRPRKLSNLQPRLTMDTAEDSRWRAVRRARRVRANGRVARGWRVTRVKDVLRRQNQEEMVDLLKKWDAWVSRNRREG